MKFELIEGVGLGKMLDIDQYAYSNQLRQVHPVEKALFTFMTMLVCLVANSIITSLAVITLMVGVVIFKAEIPLQFLIKLLLLPISFLFLATVTVVITITNSGGDFLFYFNLFGWKIGVGAGSLIKALNLFLKSLGTVSCLYFLALTTPMVELLSILKRLKIPKIFIELMILIYRFIFVLLETANLIRVSQVSRLGYSSFKNSFYSLSKLVSNLFVRSYYRAKGLLTTLLARGYEGEIKVLEPDYEYSKKNFVLIFVAEILLIILTIYVGGGDFVIINT
ncbi:cobalt ECF transporter T component CbiQ [Acetohalobium arabaticum]|nr:cobalt ECF transporter T component CbiQ [Acetohalobium arabaticum]